MIRAVIFDFNGVILDDEHLHFAMFREVLAAEGVTITERDYHETYLGLDDRGCFEAALKDAGRDAGRDRVDGMIARKAVRYFEEAGRGLKFFPGAADCLETLAARYPLAINSGALRPEIEFALGLIGRLGHVRAIVSAEQTERCKPDPQGNTLALEALRQTGLSDLDAASCLVIEDSLAGVQSAKGAGMWAVGVPNTYKGQELLDAGADAVVAGLPEFTPAWIEAHFPARDRASSKAEGAAR